MPQTLAWTNPLFDSFELNTCRPFRALYFNYSENFVKCKVKKQRFCYLMGHRIPLNNLLFLLDLKAQGFPELPMIMWARPLAGLGPTPCFSIEIQPTILAEMS